METEQHSRPNRSGKAGFNRSATLGLASGFALMSCLPPLTIALAASTTWARTQPAAADRFKEFIASPPNLAEIIWTREPSAVGPGTTSYFRMTYQQDALLLEMSDRPVLPATNAYGYTSVVSTFQNTYWAKSYNALYIWTNSGRSNERGNAADTLYKLNLAEARGILNMGCQQAGIASIHWNGDTFVLTNVELDAVVKGSLSRDDKGRAAALAVEIVKGHGRSSPGEPDFVSIYRYDYDRGHQPTDTEFLPTAISCYSGNGTGAQSSSMLERMRVLRVKIAQAPLL